MVPICIQPSSRTRRSLYTISRSPLRHVRTRCRTIVLISVIRTPNPAGEIVLWF
ncbi:hypothetical protein AG1IA_07442 [Rhizoctonia solani AG-1 IA]|uniref:Uncharacterized protein n=1 Tax=Thanatephorus cucumeris (strain AG1-IA) TaxID=983506 RepID=L8WKR7_THACA|nr:hypothetical protein AG1IA_07442 [Rhizoctonia solani AG-1 IA]